MSISNSYKQPSTSNKYFQCLHGKYRALWCRKWRRSRGLSGYVHVLMCHRIRARLPAPTPGIGAGYPTSSSLHTHAKHPVTLLELQLVR